MAPKSADPTRSGDSGDAANETTPLLTAPEIVVTEDGEDGEPSPHHANGVSKAKPTTPVQPNGAQPVEDEEKPMPYGQILLLCYTCLAEPVAYFAIFPIINEMLYRNGHLNEKDVGFWSGMIESLFSLVQMVLMIFYGRAADRLGRKPVLIFSLTGIAFATALFGVSQTLWQMVLTRCLAGVFAGSVVTVRTMISENCTKKTQGQAFSWYMFVRNSKYAHE